MIHAIKLATPSAATIGTAKIRGLPSSPENKSERTVVGSIPPAEISKDDESRKAAFCVVVNGVASRNGRSTDVDGAKADTERTTSAARSNFVKMNFE